MSLNTIQVLYYGIDFARAEIERWYRGMAIQAALSEGFRQIMNGKEQMQISEGRCGRIAARAG